MGLDPDDPTLILARVVVLILVTLKITVVQSTTLAKIIFTLRRLSMSNKQQRTKTDCRGVYTLAPLLLIHGLWCALPRPPLARASLMPADAEISMHKKGAGQRTAFAATALHPA